MPEPRVFDLTGGLLLSHLHLREVLRCLKFGGLCIMPSDTCYTLAGIPMVRGVSDDVRKILRRENEPLSISFGTQNMATRFVDLNHGSLQLMEDFAPGPVTLVVPLRANLSPDQVTALNQSLKNPKKEIAIRFPDSAVELQVSTELERPITTTAIRNRRGQPIRDFDEAAGIVAKGMARSRIRRELCAIKRAVSTFAGGLSTVVEAYSGLVRGTAFKIHRHGEIAEARIGDSLRAVGRYAYRDMDEWF